MLERFTQRRIEYSRMSPVAGILAAALLMVIGMAAPAAAYAAAQPGAVKPQAFTPRRMGASLTVVVALIGAVAGGRALARAADRARSGNRQRGAIIAMVMGPIGAAGGALVVATAKGGVGTGNGVAGGVVATTVGLIGMALGGLAMARSRRAG